jgi:hypothetical protein
MGFGIQMVPAKAEDGSRTGRVLEPADNEGRGHLGAKTAIADLRATA